MSEPHQSLFQDLLNADTQMKNKKPIKYSIFDYFQEFIDAKQR